MKLQRILAAGVTVLFLAAALPTSNAADYPPSIENLEVGQPLAAAVKPKDATTTAVVPVATSTVIPLVIGDPVSVSRAGLATKTLSNTSVANSPVKLTSSLTLGGIGASEPAPVATIKSSSKSEVQIPIDVPTRITVSGLKASATGTASFVNSQGKSVPLGKITVTKSGRVSIPALTFSKANVSYKITLVINGKRTTFTVRSTN